ncbi:UNVERIFIED_CONTAM: hypothetical protein Sradi_4807400 [Sesamum radiatum]|uniref:Uncharacterized protein n=1 Tax=Sesamum radiatum TaxID=300843 RepID=A0AAW2MWM1_SESRA
MVLEKLIKLRNQLLQMVEYKVGTGGQEFLLWQDHGTLPEFLYIGSHSQELQPCQGCFWTHLWLH